MMGRGKEADTWCGEKHQAMCCPTVASFKSTGGRVHWAHFYLKIVIPFWGMEARTETSFRHDRAPWKERRQSCAKKKKMIPLVCSRNMPIKHLAVKRKLWCERKWPQIICWSFFDMFSKRVRVLHGSSFETFERGPRSDKAPYISELDACHYWGRRLH